MCRRRDGRAEACLHISQIIVLTFFEGEVKIGYAFAEVWHGLVPHALKSSHLLPLSGLVLLLFGRSTIDDLLIKDMLKCHGRGLARTQRHGNRWGVHKALVILLLLEIMEIRFHASCNNRRSSRV